MPKHDLAVHPRPVFLFGRPQKREVDSLSLGVLDRRPSEPHCCDYERLVRTNVFDCAPEVTDDWQTDDRVVVLCLDEDALRVIADDRVDLVLHARGAAKSHVVHGGLSGEQAEHNRGEPLVLGPILELLLSDQPVVDEVDL
jgi:hypothetical protein